MLEFIALPIYLLYENIQSFTATEKIRIIIDNTLNSTFSGFIILSNELFSNCKPTEKIINDTTRADIYSNLPCPCGCSLSGGRLLNLAPIIETSEDPKSVRLLKASEITAILFINIPTDNLSKNKNRLETIPTTPANTP